MNARKLLSTNQGLPMSVTFQQVLQEIHAENWDAARTDLITATQQHPNSAKAWYYLAQVDQKLGNVQEAVTALNRADQIDPTHSFVGNMNLYNQLRSQLAVSNQSVLVKQADDYSVSHPGEGSHPYITGFLILLPCLVIAYVLTRLWRNGAAKKAAAAAANEAAALKRRVDTRLDSYGYSEPVHAHEPILSPRPAKTSHRSNHAANRSSRPSAVPPAYQHSSAPQPTVVNNHYGSNGDGMLTGVLVGSMLASSHDHDTTVVHEREVVHDTPSFDSGASSSGFDYGSSSSSDSSFDFGSSSSSDSSSSFDSGSSSSFDSGSSSFDSGSSSFDSGSSSFDSGSSDSSGW